MAILFVCSIPLISQYKYRQNPHVKKDYAGLFLVTLVVFNLYLIMTYLWAPPSSYSQEQVLSVALVIVLLCMTFLLARFDAEKTISVFFGTLFVASLIYALGGLLELSFGPSAGFTFLWGGPNVYVRVVGTGVFIAIYLWLKTDRRIWLLGIPLLFLSTLMSGSRGGITSFLLVFLLAMLLVVRKARRFFLISALILLLLLILLYVPATSAYRAFIESRYQSVSRDFPSEYQRSRGHLFSKAWQTFGRYPLLGIGIGGFHVYEYYYPHNMFLNIAAEGGFLGLAFLVLLLIPLTLRWKQERLLEHNICLTLAIFFFAASMFSGSYYDWRFVWLFLILFMTPTWIGKQQENATAELTFPRTTPN